MRFDFFRRGGRSKKDEHPPNDAHDGLPVAEEPSVALGDAPGHVTRALILDHQKSLKGYRMGWRAAGPSAGELAEFRAFVACITSHLCTPEPRWMLGRAVLFIDITSASMRSSELQSLPAQHVVLCIALDDLMREDAKETLLQLRQQGFRFMLRGAQALPEDPELRALVSHFDVGAGDKELETRIRREAGPVQPPLQMIATQVASWKDFDACAARRVDVVIEGSMALPAVATRPGQATLQPDTLLIVRMMQMIKRNEDVREIEAALEHNAALKEKLLRHINSPSMAVAVEIHSLHQAVTLLGYSPLYRWLSLLLASSAKSIPPFMLKRVLTRGRFVELLGTGRVPADESDNLFVIGMVSLFDQLLGISMEEILGMIQLTESAQQAVLQRAGPHGPYLSLAESCEADAGAAASLSESLGLVPAQVNSAHLSALLWAQDVSSADAAY
ncbi:MAG: HDOD domain-containing protein [Variovorax sp.]|nr:HDOD domain-containing protein [Variovorax sp.]